MADGPVYKVAHRRRREQKTNYPRRLALLKSGVPRLVVRKSLNYIYAQIVQYEPAGDKILASASSAELRKLGWKGHCGNTTAAYLTGMLIGTRATEADVGNVVTDIGLLTSTKGNSIYALVKGATDAGLNVPHSPEVVPPQERLTGKHVDAEAVFEEVKKKIMSQKK